MKTSLTIIAEPHGVRCSNGQSYTWSEMQAQNVLGVGLSSSDSKYTPHDAGNEIIELAERIKSERAIMAM